MNINLINKFIKNIQKIKKAQLFLLYIVFAAIACNSKGDLTLKAQEQNISIVKNVFTHFNNHDWKKQAALYADPAEFKDPSLGQNIVKQTRQQLIEKYSKLENWSSDIRDNIVQIYSSGDRFVIVEFESSGTTSDGVKWKLPLCTIFTIENGEIIKDFTYYDNN